MGVGGGVRVDTSDGGGIAGDVLCVAPAVFSLFQLRTLICRQDLPLIFFFFFKITSPRDYGMSEND